jgi:hypothetical protein
VLARKRPALRDRVIARRSERQCFCITVANSPKFAIEMIDGFGALRPAPILAHGAV